MKNRLLFIFIIPIVLIAWGRTPETPTQTQVFSAPKVIEEPLEVQPTETYVLLDLTNHERVSRGLGALALKQSLVDSAKLKCLDMKARNYWAHNLNDSTWRFFTDKGHLGENLARTNESPQKVVQAWMNSPGHRDNILGDFTSVGFASCDTGMHLIVQHLAGQ